MNDLQDRIADLKQALLAAKELSLTKLAARIQELGFRCQKCGECCQGEDNSVVVFPEEIRRIRTATGLLWLEVAGPPEEGEWDKDGCFHTLEWRLVKKGAFKGASCRFYQNGRCTIYSCRPILCRTYPFYLDNGELMHSECRGLGCKIESEEADELAEQLLKRHLLEIQEAILLLERYRDFERGEAKEGGECIVHDSEGEHRISQGKLVG
ncbi:MAG: YkgJ family cysteine cluster protein [Methanothrix sp.]|nr:YkgJ family cysteine cluster protein [Methanothrix sp.]